MTTERPNGLNVETVYVYKEQGKRRVIDTILLESAAGAALLTKEPIAAGIIAVFGILTAISARKFFKEAHKLKPKKPNQSQNSNTDI